MNVAPVVKSDFQVALAAMREHHLSRKGGDFFTAQPQFQSLIASQAVAGADAPAMPELLRPVNEALASQQKAVADAAAAGTHDAANGLKASKNVSAFHAKLEAQRQKALKDSNTNINAAFDKAEKLGNEHPAMQGGILAGMNVVQNIISTFTNLISEMVGKVVALVSDILKNIMGAVKGVIDGFKNGVGDLLGGLF